MQQDIEILKDKIKQIPPETLHAYGVIELANDGKSYICPHCRNGTGDTGDGLTPSIIGGAYVWHCFKCDAGFDNIKILAIYYGLDCRLDFFEVLKRAADDFGFCGDVVTGSNFEKYHSKNFSASKSFITNKEVKNFAPLAQDSSRQIENVEVVDVDETELAAMIKRDIDFSIENLEFLPLADRRGLLLETLKYFCCGYHPKWIHPKIRLAGNPKNVQPTRRIIIPISPRHYVAVALDSDKMKNPKAPKEYGKIPKNCWKMIAKTSDPSNFFGRQTITEKTNHIYIFEGEINAMSAWQARQQKEFLKNSMEIFGVDSATDLETGEIIAASSLKNNAYIAIGGAANKSWIKALVAGLQHYNIKPRITIIFDDDDDSDFNTGKENAENHCKTLIESGYPAITKFFNNKEWNFYGKN